MQTLSKKSQSQVRKRLDSRIRIRIACLALLLFSAMISLPGCGARKLSITLRVECNPPQSVTAVVTSAEDSGPGSLREAIDKANASPGADVIAFDLPGNRRINLRSPLPLIRDNVTINGFNQSGSLVELNGADAGANANGLTFIGSNNSVQGLVLNRFKGHGILISIHADNRTAYNQRSETVTVTAANNRVVDNFIGTDATGTKEMGNSKDGVFVDLDSADCRIEGNLIAHNNGNGISLPVGKNSPVRIAISKNRIHSNGKIGIDLGRKTTSPVRSLAV